MLSVGRGSPHPRPFTLAIYLRSGGMSASRPKYNPRSSCSAYANVRGADPLGGDFRIPSLALERISDPLFQDGHTNGLVRAQAIAAHSLLRTTKLYDRTSDAISLDEIERILI